VIFDLIPLEHLDLALHGSVQRCLFRRQDTDLQGDYSYNIDRVVCP
jgi:hypothetical protein